MLLPVGLFGAGEKHTFEHGARVHPMYFNFPYQHTDDVTIELPPGWQVEQRPQAALDDLKLAALQHDGGGCQRVPASQARPHRSISRSCSLKSYAPLRDFFQSVRAGDEEQIVADARARPRRRNRHTRHATLSPRCVVHRRCGTRSGEQPLRLPPEWMHAQVSAPLPAHDDETAAVLLYSETQF